MGFSKKELDDGYTLYEVKTNGIDDIVENLHDDEAPWFIKRQLAKNTLYGRGRLFAYIEIEINEVIGMANEFSDTDIDVIDKISNWKFRKLERKIRNLRKEFQKIMKEMKDCE